MKEKLYKKFDGKSQSNFDIFSWKQFNFVGMWSRFFGAMIFKREVNFENQQETWKSHNKRNQKIILLCIIFNGTN